MSYLDERRAYIEAGRPLKKKERKPIAKKSAKRIEKEKETSWRGKRANVNKRQHALNVLSLQKEERGQYPSHPSP